MVFVQDLRAVVLFEKQNDHVGFMVYLKPNMSTELPIKDKTGGRAPMKIAPFKSTIRRTEPHRHNGYFELIYLTAGEGVHVIDERRYTVEPPTLFVIRKDQVHCWDLTTPGEGYVLIVRKEFVDRRTDEDLRALFAAISKHPCLLLENARNVGPLWEVLLEALPANRENIPEVAQWVLKALLGVLLEKARPAVKPVRKPAGLYEQFLQLLDEQANLKRTVQHYAGLLHTTPQNLNNTCRKRANRTATDVLEDFLLKEAKRLLLYTQGTVAEISWALDFKDPSHFVKYFKRTTGQTPRSFRNG
jgi:AraC family transcriptional regulator, transcriptional activator of pobA